MKTLIIGRILAANRVLKRYILLSVGVPADSVLIVFCLEKKKKKKKKEGGIEVIPTIHMNNYSDVPLLNTAGYDVHALCMCFVTSVKKIVTIYRLECQSILVLLT